MLNISFKMRILIVVVCFVLSGCTCSQQNPRDSTSVCVELQGRMGPRSQERDHSMGSGMGQDQGDRSAPNPYQESYQPPQQSVYQPGPIMSQGMPQGMPQQGMSQGMPQQSMPQGMPQQRMHPGMPLPGMFMPPHMRAHGGLPPPMPHPCEHFAIIKRLEGELAVKDHQLAELKAIIDQNKRVLQERSEYPQNMSQPQTQN